MMMMMWEQETCVNELHRPNFIFSFCVIGTKEPTHIFNGLHRQKKEEDEKSYMWLEQQRNQMINTANGLLLWKNLINDANE